MRFAELYRGCVSTLLLVGLVSFASWLNIPTRIAAYLLFNPPIEEGTWALTRWLLRRYPEASSKQLIALLTTLPAKTSCREYQKARGRSVHFFTAL